MSHHSIEYRSVGILLISDGVILRANPLAEDRTDVVVTGDIRVGAIFRDSTTGQWHYDGHLKTFLGIEGEPVFDTDAEAGRRMQGLIPSMVEVKEKLRRLIVQQDEDE